MTQIIHSISELQQWSRNAHKAGKTVGLVPTMGFLHDGHLSLIDAARAYGADAVVISIFVNPIQFGPNEDFDKYPRDFERDRALCEARNVDVIFAPGVQDMYAAPLTCHVYENTISKNLCGKSRPVHFEGVTTVVSKLFNAALPDLAVFGQKDAQQAAIIRRMVRDLNFPIKIITAPIVREADGLAMSSRNKYLSEDEHRRALAISHSLFRAQKTFAAQPGVTADKLIADIRAEITAAGGAVEYVELTDSDTMLPAAVLEPGKSFTIAVAAKFGTTRLIDNILIK